MLLVEDIREKRQRMVNKYVYIKVQTIHILWSWKDNALWNFNVNMTQMGKNQT